MMAKKAFDKIMAGAEAALAHARGDKDAGTPHIVRVPAEVDVAALRCGLNLSQSQFAARFGLDIRALQDWEQRRRKPDRAARVLLTVIGTNPTAVDRALATGEPNRRPRRRAQASAMPARTST